MVNIINSEIIILIILILLGQGCGRSQSCGGVRAGVAAGAGAIVNMVVEINHINYS